MTTALTNDFIVRAGLVVQGTTAVTSSTGQTGAAQINGGLAVAKNTVIGQNLTVGGVASFNGGITIAGATTLTNLTVNGLSQFNGNAVTSGTSYVFGAATFGDDIYALKNIRTAGGLTVTQVSSLLGGITVSNGATVNGVSTFNGQIFATGTTGITVGSGAVELGGTLSVAGNTLLSSTTAANVAGSGSGALKVAGGAFVGDNLIVNSTAWNTATNSANALYVKGGAWIDESLVVAGQVLFKDGVTFNGTATYVQSTNTFYTDNLLDLHVPPGGVGTPWVFDDGKDIGIVYHYYKGADKRAFLGFANDTGHLEWYDNGTESSGVFTGTSYGTFKTGDIRLVGLTDASNTVTGALQVAGGVGIGMNVYAGGDISGGTITSRNLTQNRLVLAGASSQLTDAAELTWNSGSAQIEGRIAFANTATVATNATNLAGGAAGDLPYQTAADTTAFLNIGSNGYVLQSNGSAPFWGPATGVVAGSANTATNIADGVADQIPFQSAPGVTTFSTDLTFDGTTFTTPNVALTSLTDTAGNATTGALQVAGGVGIAKSLWVGNSATIAGNLYVDGDIILQGAGLNTLNAQTGTFEYVVITGTTGTGLSVTGDAAIDRNLVVQGSATVNNIISDIGTVGSFTATNAFAANLEVSGGTTVQGLVAANITATTLSVSGQSTLQDVTASGAEFTTLTVTGNESVQGNLAVAGVSTFTGKILVSDTTNASAVNVGSIVTQGGVGVAKDVIVGGSITVGSTVANTVVPAILSNNVLLSSFTSNSISGTTTQNLDTFSAATYRTARYTIQIVDGSSIHVTEMTVFHDGTNVYMNEYGISTNNGQLGSFDARLSAGSVTLQFTPTSATAMTIKVVRLGITA